MWLKIIWIKINNLLSKIVDNIKFLIFLHAQTETIRKLKIFAPNIPFWIFTHKSISCRNFLQMFENILYEYYSTWQHCCGYYYLAYKFDFGTVKSFWHVYSRFEVYTCIWNIYLKFSWGNNPIFDNHFFVACTSDCCGI